MKQLSIKFRLHQLALLFAANALLISCGTYQNVTYGDGISNVNLNSLLKIEKKRNKKYSY